MLGRWPAPQRTFARRFGTAAHRRHSVRARWQSVRTVHVPRAAGPRSERGSTAIDNLGRHSSTDIVAAHRLLLRGLSACVYVHWSQPIRFPPIPLCAPHQTRSCVAAARSLRHTIFTRKRHGDARVGPTHCHWRLSIADPRGCVAPEPTHGHASHSVHNSSC